MALSPKAGANLKVLEELFLNDNQLSGSLPSSWNKLKTLKFLVIYQNHLKGPPPESWKELQHVEGGPWP